MPARPPGADVTAVRVLVAYGLAWALQPALYPAAMVCTLLAHQWNAEQQLPDGPQGGENSVDEEMAG